MAYLLLGLVLLSQTACDRSVDLPQVQTSQPVIEPVTGRGEQDGSGRIQGSNRGTLKPAKWKKRLVSDGKFPASAARGVISKGEVWIPTALKKMFVLSTLDGAELACLDLGFHPISNLVITNGRIFSGGNEGRLACFDLAKRSLAWEVSTGDSGDISSIICPDAGSVMASSSDGTIFALNSSDGKITAAKRYFQRGSGLGMSLLGGLLVARASNEVWTIRTQDLAVLWKHKLDPGCWVNELASDENGIYSVVECNSGNNGQRVMRFDPGDGQDKILYEQKGPLYWPLCLLPNGIAVSRNSGLMVLNRQTGKMIWEKELEFPASNMFAVGQRIYSLNDKKVICLDAEKGEILASQEGLFQPERAIATERLLIVVSRDLSVCCYELQ